MMSQSLFSFRAVADHRLSLMTREEERVHTQHDASDSWINDKENMERLTIHENMKKLSMRTLWQRMTQRENRIKTQRKREVFESCVTRVKGICFHLNSMYANLSEGRREARIGMSTPEAVISIPVNAHWKFEFQKIALWLTMKKKGKKKMKKKGKRDDRGVKQKSRDEKEAEESLWMLLTEKKKKKREILEGGIHRNLQTSLFPFKLYCMKIHSGNKLFMLCTLFNCRPEIRREGGGWTGKEPTRPKIKVKGKTDPPAHLPSSSYSWSLSLFLLRKKRFRWEGKGKLTINFHFLLHFCSIETGSLSWNLFFTETYYTRKKRKVCKNKLDSFQCFV